MSQSRDRNLLTVNYRRLGCFWRITTKANALRPPLPSNIGTAVTFEAIFDDFDDFASVPYLDTDLYAKRIFSNDSPDVLNF